LRGKGAGGMTRPPKRSGVGRESGRDLKFAPKG
jgi:hypothetical protein